MRQTRLTLNTSTISLKMKASNVFEIEEEFVDIEVEFGFTTKQVADRDQEILQCETSFPFRYLS